jgi:hypothetical protein
LVNDFIFDLVSLAIVVGVLVAAAALLLKHILLVVVIIAIGGVRLEVRLRVGELGA